MVVRKANISVVDHASEEVIELSNNIANAVVPTVLYSIAREGATPPKRATDGSAGYDICAYLSMYEPDGLILFGRSGTKSIPTGIILEVPSGYDCLIRPRSGLSVKNVHVYPGTIDSDYRGEVNVLVKMLAHDGEYVIHHGDRIAQLVFTPIVYPVMQRVIVHAETKRGKAGFGSTGR